MEASIGTNSLEIVLSICRIGNGGNNNGNEISMVRLTDDKGFPCCILSVAGASHSIIPG